MTNEQAALMAANAKKYSITSFDHEIDRTLAAAERFLEWLDSKSTDQGGDPPPPNVDAALAQLDAATEDYRRALEAE